MRLKIAILAGDGAEDVDGFVGDFGADAVAGCDQNLQLHAYSL
jgi:hypothetical protein